MEAPVVVTGAGGFVGSALVAHFARRGRAFRAIVRRQEHAVAPMAHVCRVCDLVTAPLDELDELAAGAAAVVHLAGRAHVLRDTSADPAAAYASANVSATERIAGAAVRAGVRRFVLTSSIKVNGEASERGRPFRPDDPPHPSDDYAKSKWSAEKTLAAVAAGTSMVPIALRLPLVYGPGVKANFALLLDEVARRRLLPLGAIDNLRSVLYVGNLVDAIDAALDATEPLSGVHFVTDAKSVSTPALVRAAGVALGTPARLVAVPVPLLRIGGALSGRSEKLRRLVDTLEADASSFAAATGWQPRHTLADGLAATASWWRMRHAI